MSIDEKRRRKNIKIASVLLVIVSLMLISLTYAYFMHRNSIELGQIKAGTLVMEFEDGKEELMLNDAIPIYEENIETEANYTTFTISNVGTLDMYTQIYFKDVTISDELKSSDFKWRIEDGEGNIINNGDFSNFSGEKYYLVNNIFIPATEQNSKKFVVRIWLNENGQDQSIYDSKSFSAKIGSTGYTRKMNLLNIITTSEKVQTEYSFEKKSGNKGLFQLKENNDLYFFKGSVTNNYVEFGTDEKGNPISWRILWLDKKGNIKLIKSSGIGKISIYNEKNVSDYVNEDGTDSEIKTMVDEWYNTTLGNDPKLDNLVIDTDFCQRGYYNDNMIGCKSDKDKVTTRAGLVNVYELKLAGVYENNSNHDPNMPDYLPNDSWINLAKINGFTMSSSSSSGVWATDNSYGYTEINLGYNHTYSFNPVITISSDAVVTKGHGDLTSPFTIEQGK